MSVYLCLKNLKGKLQAFKDTNETLNCEIESHKNEIQLLSESVSELEALVASKDTELIKVANKRKPDYSESAKLGEAENQLRESQIQIEALNDEISELKTNTSHWESQFLASTEEARTMNSRCQTLMLELEENEKMLCQLRSKEIAHKDTDNSKSEEIEELRSATSKMEKELAEALERLEVAQKHVQEMGEVYSPRYSRH